MSTPKLRLLADENVHQTLITFLKKAGADVKRVPSGISNGAVLHILIGQYSAKTLDKKLTVLGRVPER